MEMTISMGEIDLSGSAFEASIAFFSAASGSLPAAK